MHVSVFVLFIFSLFVNRLNMDLKRVQPISRPKFVSMTQEIRVWHMWASDTYKTSWPIGSCPCFIISRHRHEWHVVVCTYRQWCHRAHFYVKYPLDDLYHPCLPTIPVHAHTISLKHKFMDKASKIYFYLPQKIAKRPCKFSLTFEMALSPNFNDNQTHMDTILYWYQHSTS